MEVNYNKLNGLFGLIENEIIVYISVQVPKEESNKTEFEFYVYDALNTRLHCDSINKSKLLLLAKGIAFEVDVVEGIEEAFKYSSERLVWNEHVSSLEILAFGEKIQLQLKQADSEKLKSFQKILIKKMASCLKRKNVYHLILSIVEPQFSTPKNISHHIPLEIRSSGGVSTKTPGSGGFTAKNLRLAGRDLVEPNRRLSKNTFGPETKRQKRRRISEEKQKDP